MNHGSTNKISKLIPAILFSALLVVGFQEGKAQDQATQTFKVGSPEDARPLVRDTVDNFLSFAPVFAEGKTFLRWLVENDRKSGVFIIERSGDGKTFEPLGFKDRVGSEKNLKLFYSFVDEAPPLGYAHYRIMQVGTDHTYTYSSVIRVKTAPENTSGGNAIQDQENSSEK